MVRPISFEETKPFILEIHYAKRMPSLTFKFGLFKKDGVGLKTTQLDLFSEESLVGMVSYGSPPSPSLCKGVCGSEFKDQVLELNRLVVNDNLDKNALSYFVSSSIKKLPKPKIIVSFSDNNMFHNGYIYQATNFIYTGQTANDSMYIDKEEKEFHFRNLGHYQKNNRLNVSLIKRRLNEDKIDKIEIANYLRKHKGVWTAKKLDKVFGYKDTAAHWFRTDNGFSFASIDDWKRLKELLSLDNSLDDVMLSYEWVADVREIIKKLELKKIDILPKNRYIFISANKKEKNKIIASLKYKGIEYPKGNNKRYNTDFKPTIQTELF